MKLLAPVSLPADVECHTWVGQLASCHSVAARPALWTPEHPIGRNSCWESKQRLRTIATHPGSPNSRIHNGNFLRNVIFHLRRVCLIARQLLEQTLDLLNHPIRFVVERFHGWDASAECWTNFNWNLTSASHSIGFQLIFNWVNSIVGECQTNKWWQPTQRQRIVV